MAAGFPDAIDIGIRLEDILEWELKSEPQSHGNPRQAATNLRHNGATHEEAEFIASGQRVELNMLTSRQFIEFVEGKLQEHGVQKVIPDLDTLQAAWDRAIRVNRINTLIRGEQATMTLDVAIPPPPDDLADRIRGALDDKDSQFWDHALWEKARRAP